MAYVVMTERSGVAVTNGFIVVRIQARNTSPQARSILVDGYVDDEHVTSASAADNHLDGVISSGRQSFTMPVQAGDKWRVEVSGGGDFEIRWIAN